MAVIKWIHLTVDMFDDEKIRLIEKMPDPDSLLIIWVKLICQAGKVNDGGAIYLSDQIAYNEEDLSTIFNRPVNVIRLALKTFSRLGMIDIDNNGVIFLNNWEKHQNIDGLDRIREQTRLRVGRFRDKQRLLTSGNVTVTFGNVPPSPIPLSPREREEEKNRGEEEKETLQVMLREGRFKEIHIGSNTLDTIIRCLKGDQPCNKTNLKIYCEQLEKLGITLDQIGITPEAENVNS